MAEEKHKQEVNENQANTEASGGTSTGENAGASGRENATADFMERAPIQETYPGVRQAGWGELAVLGAVVAAVGLVLWLVLK